MLRRVDAWPIRAFHAVCRLAVGVSLVALVTHTWLVMGLVVPVTVAGSSMAPTLNGPHGSIVATLARKRLQSGSIKSAPDMAADCPQCGDRCETTSVRDTAATG